MNILYFHFSHHVSSHHYHVTKHGIVIESVVSPKKQKNATPKRSATKKPTQAISNKKALTIADDLRKAASMENEEVYDTNEEIMPYGARETSGKELEKSNRGNGVMNKLRSKNIT